MKNLAPVQSGFAIASFSFINILRDLLKRLENLLLLAETGIMAKSSKTETENDEAIVQQEQQKEVMKKRNAQHREMVMIMSND